MITSERRIGPIGQIRRYREIVSVLVKYGFIDVVHALGIGLALGILKSGRL